MILEKSKIPPFPDEILEHIAGIISETRSGSDITRFFKSAGYPEFIHDGSTKKWFVLNCLRALNERSNGSYHVIKIIEKLADPKQYINAPQIHKNILGDLNRALIFHGIKINKDNHVVLSQKSAPSSPEYKPTERKEIEVFRSLTLHPKILEVSEKLFIDGHYAQAIFEAFKAVNNYVKEKSRRSDLDGQRLMAEAFNENDPIIKLNPLKSQSDKDEQMGFKFIYMGSIIGIRNPKAHDQIEQKDPIKTLKYLSLASLLIERAEEGKVDIK